MANLRANKIYGTSGPDANGSALFNGTDYLTAANSSAFRLNQGSTENFTMEAWIYFTGTDYGYISGIYETSGNQRSYLLYLSSDFELKFNYASSGTAASVSTLNAGVVPKNEWVHVAIAHEVSTTTLRLFKNGIEKATDNAPHSTYYANTTSDFELGKQFVGNISNFHITKSCKYTGNFTPYKEPIEEDSNTTVLCLNSRLDVLNDDKSNTFVQTASGGVNPTSDMPFSRSDAGVVFDGDIKINSQGYMYFPTGDTSQRGRGRGVFCGGRVTNDMQYINIQSGGNSLQFGEDTGATETVEGFGLASSTRAVFGGGVSYSNKMEYVTIATTSNTTDFGDLTVGRRSGCGMSNQTRGVIAGGIASGPSVSDVMDYITIATTGNATDFGDLTAGTQEPAGINSPTRGVIAGGANPGVSNTIEYITIATTGDATNFGDLTVAQQAAGGSSSSTRGLIMGGMRPANNVTIDYITIASTGDAVDFGDLSVARAYNGTVSNSIRGVTAGGNANPVSLNTNSIEYVDIATTGNANDFGDLYVATRVIHGASDSHGGIS